jgi:hypothetical protein
VSSSIAEQRFGAVLSIGAYLKLSTKFTQTHGRGGGVGGGLVVGGTGGFLSDCRTDQTNRYAVVRRTMIPAENRKVGVPVGIDIASEVIFFFIF